MSCCLDPSQENCLEKQGVPNIKSVYHRLPNMQGLWVDGLRAQVVKMDCPYFEKYNWTFLMGASEESTKLP